MVKDETKSAPLNWAKSDPQATRIRKALASRSDDLLATARGLNALANTARDTQKARLARQDARLLFACYKAKKET